MNPHPDDADALAVRIPPAASLSIIERHNLAVVDRVYEALLAGLPDLIRPEMTKDVELEIIGPAMVPASGHWTGRDDVLTALDKNSACIRDQRPDIVSKTAHGDSVVVVLREQSESLHTGHPYDIHWVQIVSFRDGMICRIREVADGLDLAVAFLG